jgi:hypothetical protein
MADPSPLYDLCVKTIQRLAFDEKEFSDYFSSASCVVPPPVARDIRSGLPWYQVYFNVEDGFRQLLCNHVFNLQKSDFYIGDEKWREVSFDIRGVKRWYQYRTVCYGTKAVIYYLYAIREIEIVDAELIGDRWVHLQPNYGQLWLYILGRESLKHNFDYIGQPQCHERNHVSDSEKNCVTGRTLNDTC